MEIRELKQCSWAIPTIYEFRTFEDRPVFFRWRHNGLKITIGPTGASHDSGPYEEGWFYIYTGGVNKLDFPGVNDGGFPEEPARAFLATLQNEMPSNAKPCV